MNIDRAIDEVAREMTSAEAPDLRRAVMAQIAADDGRRSPFGVRRSPFGVRRSSFGVRRWLVVPAAAAAIVIALFITRERTAPVRVKPDATAAAAAAPSVATPAHDAADGIPAPRTLAPRTVAARIVTPRTAMRDALPALERNDVASIAVAPLAVDTMTQEPIQLEPLDAVAPIGVAPLDLNDSSRRNQ